PFPGCTISITNQQGVSISATTNELGIYVFSELVHESAVLMVNCGNKSYDISRRELNYSKPKDEIITIYIYPTADFEKELLKLEDLKFGEASKEKPLIPVSEDILTKCDSNVISPDFIGGTSAMNTFISNNIKYPQESIELGEKGKVYVTFIVEQDGTITHVQVIKGISKWIDREARRTIRLMPNWKPADCGGEKIRTRMNLPIQFG
ncbi:MAG: hypothetical protein RI883_419, partial [Bacteroidota bacterium]